MAYCQPSLRDLGGQWTAACPTVETVGYCQPSLAGLWGTHPAVEPDIIRAFGARPKIWAVCCYGPSRTWQAAEWFPIDLKLGRLHGVPGANKPADGYDLIYDPTNGTKSLGSLARFGGEVQVSIMGK